MPILTQIETGQVDLIALIMQSHALNTRLNKEQIEEYIEKVKQLPHEKQINIYQILMEEREKLADIENRMKDALIEYNRQLEMKKQEIIQSFFKQAEREEQAECDKDISTLLHQLDE